MVKNALLDALLAEKVDSDQGVRPSPPRPAGGTVSGKTAPQQLNSAHSVPVALQAESGRCGSCRRWTPAEYPLEGECNAGRRAHGWFDGDPQAPVLTTPHHRCAAQGGQGWQAK